MKKILVFGGSGLVGSKFLEVNKDFFEFNAPDVTQIDILKKDQISQITQQFNPDTVINFAAYTQVENAEKETGNKDGICYLINALGAKNVAEVCKKFNKKLIHISTEYVFDGAKSENPYTEKDQPHPINWYGTTKYLGEQFVLESGSLAVIVRICMPFSAFYSLKLDVARFFVKQFKDGNEIKAIKDQKITPTLVDDIANALQVIIKTDTQGIYHVSSRDSTTPFEFANLIAQKFNLMAILIKPVSFDEYHQGKQAKLLRNSWLSSAKFTKDFGMGILHTIEESVENFKHTVDEDGLN